MDMKRIWTTPQLIVLTRGRPEEVLTLQCKASGQAIGAARRDNKCDMTIGQGKPCGACQAENLST